MSVESKSTVNVATRKFSSESDSALESGTVSEASSSELELHAVTERPRKMGKIIEPMLLISFGAIDTVGLIFKLSWSELTFLRGITQNLLLDCPLLNIG